MITKKEDAWIQDFVPQHTWKGQRLYHRKNSMTEKQRYMSNFFERIQDEGLIASETPDTLTAMQDGFITSFFMKDGKWKGLGYRKAIDGHEMNLETPYAPTREDAGRMLTTFINAYTKSLNK